MKINYINNKRGVTLIQIFIVIVIVLALTTSISTVIVKVNKQRTESEIASNIAQLESIVKTYYNTKNQYPVKEAINLMEINKGRALRTFFDETVTLTGNTPENINSRIKVIDYEVLRAEGYLSTDIRNAENYILDKKTGKVYYIDEGYKLPEIQEQVERMLSDAGDVIQLRVMPTLEEIVIEKNGNYMTEVLTTVSEGNKLIVGGDGSIKLAVVILSEIDGVIGHEIIDLTPQLKGPAPEAVTELRYIGNNKIIAHYYDGNKLAYQTIDI